VLLETLIETHWTLVCAVVGCLTLILIVVVSLLRGEPKVLIYQRLIGGAVGLTGFLGVYYFWPDWLATVCVVVGSAGTAFGLFGVIVILWRRHRAGQRGLI